MRPNLDGILSHDFLQMNSIPKTLPAALLACPPSAQFVKQHMAESLAFRSAQNTQQPQKNYALPGVQQQRMMRTGAQSTDPLKRAMSGNGASSQKQLASAASGPIL